MKVNPKVALLALAIGAFAIGTTEFTPMGLLPNDDTGQLIVTTEAAQDIGFDAMSLKQQQAAEIIQQSPYVDATMSSIGAGGSSQSLNQGRILIRLKPRKQRPGADQIIQELRPKLSHITGFKVFLQNIPVIRIGGRLTKSQYQYALQDADIDELFLWAPRLTEKIATLPGFQDVTSDLQINLPKVLVEVDRDKASLLGLTQEQIENALYSAYGSRQISTIYTSSNQYAVILELQPQFQRDERPERMRQQPAHPADPRRHVDRLGRQRLPPGEGQQMLRQRAAPLRRQHRVVEQLPAARVVGQPPA